MSTILCSMYDISLNPWSRISLVLVGSVRISISLPRNPPRTSFTKRTLLIFTIIASMISSSQKVQPNSKMSSTSYLWRDYSKQIMLAAIYFRNFLFYSWPSRLCCWLILQYRHNSGRFHAGASLICRELMKATSLLESITSTLSFKLTYSIFFRLLKIYFLFAELTKSDPSSFA